jgi:hypothetical protein
VKKNEYEVLNLWGAILGLNLWVPHPCWFSQGWGFLSQRTLFPGCRKVHPPHLENFETFSSAKGVYLEKTPHPSTSNAAAPVETACKQDLRVLKETVWNACDPIFLQRN